MKIIKTKFTKVNLEKYKNLFEVYLTISIVKVRVGWPLITMTGEG